jgi:type IV pilus assembly protein PilA
MSTRSLKRGFTLIELLLVIGIIAILAAIVIVAINPTKQLGDARNAQRRSDVNTILNAVYQYSIDHNGDLPATITATATEICKSGVDVTCGSLINLNVLTGAYLVALPNDPQADAAGVSTDYTILRDASTKRVTVAAPSAEQSATISVTR